MSRQDTPDPPNDEDDGEVSDAAPDGDNADPDTSKKRKSNARPVRKSKKKRADGKSRPESTLTVNLIVDALPKPTKSAPIPDLPIRELVIELSELDQLDEKLAWLGKVLKLWFTDWTKRDASPLWMALLELEQAYKKRGWADGRLGSKYRPSLVHDWIQAARYDRSKGVQIKLDRKHRAAYIEDWHAWWRCLQPEWRRGGESDGVWDVLIAPGENGFLSVAATLWWWADAVDKEEDEYAAWVAAMTDVTNVMTAITTDVKAGYTPSD